MIQKGFLSTSLVALMATTGLGQNVFLVELDTGTAQTHNTGSSEKVFMVVGQTITVGIYLTDGVSNTPINAYQWQIPCTAVANIGAGAVDYVDLSIAIDTGRADFIFLGGALLISPAQGTCPVGGVPFGDPAMSCIFFPVPNPVLVGASPAVYLGHFSITVTSGSVGDEYQYDLNCVSADGCSPDTTFLRDINNSGAPYVGMTKDALIIHIGIGICGNGIIEHTESCDDGNFNDGDGCSSTCTVEPGYACEGEPSTCTEICGDGLIVGGEQCDDGDTDDGDGCSSACTVEPGYACEGEPSTCTGICGDGLIVGGEQCDDFNMADGDGCSSACTTEAGFTCTGEPSMCIENTASLNFFTVNGGGATSSSGTPPEAGAAVYTLVASTAQPGGVGVITSANYTLSDGFWFVALTCAIDSECEDGVFCTSDACDGGSCVNDAIVYGDVNNSGVVDLDDILCVIAGFGDAAACPTADIAGCEADGLIDLDDILAIIGAFGGADPCCG